MAELKKYVSNGRVDPEDKYEPDREVELGDVNVDGAVVSASNGQGSSYTLGNGKEDSSLRPPPKDSDDENGKGSDDKTDKILMVGSFEVFRFADSTDKILMFFGSLFAAANGAALPIMIVVFGSMIDFMVDIGKLELYLNTIPEFLQNNSYERSDFFADTTKLDQAICDEIVTFYGGARNCSVTLNDKIMDKMTEFSIYYVIIGVAVLVGAYIQVAFWMTAAERQGNRIRKACLHNILLQDIGWFDTHEAAELNTKLSDDILKIQEGLGDKMGAFFQWTAGFITGFAIGFYYGWKMTLVILAVSPAMAISAGIMTKLASSMTTKELQAYSRAGAIAEEVFLSMRTVVAFGGQEKEAVRYYNNLDVARKFGIKKGFTNGASMGVIWLVIFCCYALGFWYGGKLHREEPEDFSVSNVMIVFFSVLIGAFSIGNAAPSLQAFSTSRGAAYGIYQLIDLKSPIDSYSKEGEKPSKVTGLIQFKNIHFRYPARPDVKVLDDLSIEAHPGQTVALVGSSGCGKSTTVQLLLRFYDPEQGQVLLDGKDIKDLNVEWLRKSIGLVSQEPILFATSIAENIRYGKEEVSMDEIITATKNANAYDFIMQLPDKFNTLVGERGAQLSGGQKQRIAIARALVRDPKILLLDEATSALDTESEAIVQDALDKARMGRTTLVIAHRLSTIKTADIIIGLHKGKVMEQGTHDQLMAVKGIYHQLVMNQSASQEKDEGDKEIENMLEMQDKKKLERMLSSKKLTRQNSKVSEKEEEAADDLPDAPFSRLLKLNAPEWYFILLGCLGSIINGAVMPAFAVIFSRIIDVFAEDEDTQETEIQKYALMFVGLGALSFFTFFLQSYMFACSGEGLTLRIRDLAFRSMIRQEIVWFDDTKNGVGALTTRLSTDASQVQGVTGSRLGGLLMSLSNILTALIIAFIYGWKMTLVILGFLPFIALGGFMQIKLMAGQAGKNKEALEGAGKVTVESIGNIRTVAALSQEETFYKRYMDNLVHPYKAALKNAHVVGAVYSFSQAIIYFAYAAAFVFGGYMIEEDEMGFDDVFLVFGSVVFGAMGLGNASAFAPDIGKAQLSAKRILQILDSKPTIDYTNPGGKKLGNDFSAVVTFKDVKFHYATRASVPVLQGLNVSVAPGETLALVGSSGCGKSTTIQLMERFYDAISGSVCLDDFDIKTLNIEWYRSQLGLVSQEPILFDSTIGENIAYGDNSRAVPISDIMEAARGANIHTFITSLPDGYNTSVGAMGTQLSGGQKQRIAIARALLRNPKVLLLDEATSALDTESEKIVQEALDKARSGRTCVVIAHRLSTVQNADKICVVSHGRVTEQGTHNELMAKEGFYYKLVKNSQRQV